MSDPSLLTKVSAWKPDAFIVAGWYHMIPRAWRNLAPAFGLHASLLPDYSGGAPLVWAMINGESETGITLFKMGDGVDDGPIVGYAKTAIGHDDDIASLYARIEDLGVGLVEAYVPRLAAGTAPLHPQDESRRRRFPQRGPEDGRIDWTQPAARIHDFVRAQTRPYPGAFGAHAGREVRIWRSEVVTEVDAPVGVAILDDERAVVACGDGGGIALLEVGESGIDSSGADWLRGCGDVQFD